MFKDDRDFLPLQAADILAWFLRTSFRDRVPGLETVWRRPARTGFEWLSAELLRDLPHSKYSTIWGHERIADIQRLSRRIAAIFNDSCSNAALFLCNPDRVAERSGFEPSLPFVSGR